MWDRWMNLYWKQRGMQLLIDLKGLRGGSAQWVASLVERVAVEGWGQELWAEQSNVESAMDHCWEMLHLGDWKQVADAWRKAYGVTAWMNALVCWTRGDWKEALRLVDLVLLMGHGELHSIAHEAASKVSQ